MATRPVSGIIFVGPGSPYIGSEGVDFLANKFARLATYLPLGSYVIYTTMETYAYSLGPALPIENVFVNTTVTTANGNYTCLIDAPIGSYNYAACTNDQRSALIVALCVGFFLALFLSFVKRVPLGGTPPLSIIQHHGGGVGEKRMRRGVLYARGADYYMDFGDVMIWGHALVSVISFGTLTLFSSAVGQCLFPNVKPWIFVVSQMLGLVACSLIGMFWINDDSLGIESSVYTVASTTAVTTTTTTSNPTNPSATTSSMVEASAKMTTHIA